MRRTMFRKRCSTRNSLFFLLFKNSFRERIFITTRLCKLHRISLQLPLLRNSSNVFFELQKNNSREIIFLDIKKQAIFSTTFFPKYSTTHNLFFTPNRVASFATLFIFLNVLVCVCVCVQRQGLHGSLRFAFLYPRFLLFTFSSKIRTILKWEYSKFSCSINLFQFLINYVLLDFSLFLYSILYNLALIVNISFPHNAHKKSCTFYAQLLSSLLFTFL